MQQFSNFLVEESFIFLNLIEDVKELFLTWVVSEYFWSVLKLTSVYYPGTHPVCVIASHL